MLIIVTFLGVYTGAYISLLDPRVVIEWRKSGTVLCAYREPAYSIDQEIIEILFEPVARVDMFMRKAYWSTAHDGFKTVPPISWEELNRTAKRGR